MSLTTMDDLSGIKTQFAVPRDCPSDNALNAIAEVAAQSAMLPIGLVTFLTRHRQFFLGRHGADISETPIDQSICATTARRDAPLIIPDIHKDDQFRDIAAAAGMPDIRFYAGVPIILDGGVRSGTVCILDIRPRHDITAETLSILTNLAQAAGRIISDRLKSEEARQAAMQRQGDAEKASRSKSVFIATMSHELRTPLNAVIGFTEVLDCELYGPLGDPRYKAYTGHILESSHHLLSLIDDILTLSTVDADGEDFSLETVDLAEEVNWCLHLLQTKAAFGNLRVKNEIDSNSLLVTADRQRTRQVLLNIMSNAVKYTPAGGTVALSGATDGDQAALRVCDDGIGIDKKTLAAIGEPFLRGEEAEKSAVPGSGLGLALSKRLMDRMAGALGIQSEPAVGTTVTLTWPKAFSRP